MAFQLNPNIIRDALAKATQELPPLPSVLVKILELTESSNSGSVNEIEELIRSDQAISSKLLRVVNSAYFGLSGQVASVNQAIVVLGYSQVRNLVLSVSMMSAFGAVGTKAKEAQTRCWEQAFAASSAAQLIGRRKKFDSKDQEFIFLGGLLQNIGSLFMLSTLQRSYLSILEEVENSGGKLNDVENLRMGTDHANVGGELMKKWKLPENLILLVQNHEGPFEGEPVPTLYACHIAERVAQLITRDQEFSVEALGLQPTVLEWIAFDDSDWDWLITEVKIKLQAAMDLIGSLNN